jgi:Ca-activated chloride channel family protein
LTSRPHKRPGIEQQKMEKPMITQQALPLYDAPLSTTDTTGFGALETESVGCLPLTAMDVRSHVSGLWYRTRVEQSYCNTTDQPIEATYIFPLPDRAAVHTCVLHVGERRVEAELKERSAARADYDEAIAAGHRAAIAEEDRSGVFSLRAGNIPAGETVRVEFEMVGPLEIDSGEATFRFPLVVAPRYVPGKGLEGVPVGGGIAQDTNQVPDASRVTPPVLLPGFPNPVALSLEVTIDPAGLEPAPGAWREEMTCSLHSVVSESGPPWRVCLEPGERLNRDFLLRFPITGEVLGSSLQVSPATATSSGTLAVTLTPDQVDAESGLVPRDVVVLLDRSGSMGGWKMVAARRAAGRLIDSLGDDDRFGVIAFDSVVESDIEDLQPATDRNRFAAVSWLSGLEARGGTEMGEAFGQAARWLGETTDRDRIIVLVTDGQVAGEDIVLQQLKEASASRMPRIFSVGIDQAVNAGFLRRLADLGGGLCELVESEDRLDEVMDRIARRLQPPRLTELSIESDDLAWEPSSMVPSRLPDLFPGRPVTILARHSETAGPSQVRVCGRRPDGSTWTTTLTNSPGDTSTLASAWGRFRVRELEDRVAAGIVDDVDELQQEIVRVSLESGVLSRYTAFVAVDESELINSEAPPLEITQAVEMAAGWAAPCADMSPSFCNQMESADLRCDAGPPSGPAAFKVEVLSRDLFSFRDEGDIPAPDPADPAEPDAEEGERRVRKERARLEAGLMNLIEGFQRLERLQAELNKQWANLSHDHLVETMANFTEELLELLELSRMAFHSTKSDIVADHIEEFFRETTAYLEWLRLPEGRPAPFATHNEWFERAAQLLHRAAADCRDVLMETERVLDELRHELS